MAPEAAAGTAWRHRLAVVPRFLLALLLALAILDMLAGVMLRYVVVRITDFFDVAPVSFFWAEEVGELALAWLTLLGAAVALVERTHFALAILTHRLPPRARAIVGRANHLLIAGFGVLVAVYGWKLCLLNASLATPALQISLAWLYAAAVVGGGLIAAFGLAVALGLLPVPEIETSGGA